MFTTLLISTYNWPQALALVLESVFNQSILPNEIVIADDGSSDDTSNLIDSYTKTSKIPLIHIWHEDKGFRKSAILNKAILAANGDYIIQIDGDVILHKHFIKDHLNNSSKGCFLFGSRVSLSSSLSKKVLYSKKNTINYLSSGIKKRNRLIRIPFFIYFSKERNTNSKKIRGCNISYWKKDALDINGYNEDFVGWGYEDYEFTQRLLNNNISGKRLKHIAIQYHLYHKQAPKGDKMIGDQLLTKTIENKISHINSGIIKKN